MGDPTAARVALALAGLGGRFAYNYAQRRARKLSRQLFKNRAGLLAAAAGVGGANIAYATKRVGGPEGTMKQYYRVEKNPAPPPKQRAPRKQLRDNIKRGPATVLREEPKVVKHEPSLTVGAKRKIRTTGYAAGRFRRPKRVKRAAPKGIKNTREVYGLITGQNAVYHGFHTSGGQKEILRGFAESLLRVILYDIGCSFESRTAAMRIGVGSGTNVTYPKIVLYFYQLNGSGAVTTDAKNITLQTSLGVQTFDQVTDDILTELNNYAWTNGSCLSGYEVYESIDGVTRSFRSNFNIADCKFSAIVKTRCKVQNQTVTDGASKDTDQVDSNPLEGRIYKFSAGAPRLREQFMKAHESDVGLLSNDEEANGIIKMGSKTATCYQPGGLLHSTPSGSTLWSNHKASSNVRLDPGSYKFISTTFKFSGTVRQFFKKVFQTADTKSRYTLGESVLIGLEPAMRSTETDAVKVAYNIDFDMHTHLQLRRKIVVPSKNIGTLLNVNA